MLNRTHIFMVSMAALLAVTIYWPGLSGGYVFDDFPNFVHNDRTQMESLAPGELWNAAFASGSGPLARPLSMLSFGLERYFFGLDPFPMKLTNVLIHAVNTGLVFLLANGLIARLRLRHPERTTPLVSGSVLALTVTVAWSLAPINLTAVLVVVQRMESLAALFILGGLLAYIHGRSLVEDGAARRGWSWAIGGLVIGGGLGILAKETAVMLPLYALLVEWMMFGFGESSPNTRRGLIKLYTLLLIVPAAIGLAAYLPGIFSGDAYANRPFTLAERLWTQAHVLWHYLAWVIAPSPATLTLYHDAFPVARGPFQPWTSLPAALGLLLLVTGAFALHRRAPLVAFGILWFFVMHMLVSTVLPLELVYEHRNYLSSLGVFLALFGLLFTGRPGDSLLFVRKALAVGFITLYGFLTFLRANEWSDPLQLAYFEATRQTESPRANYELGNVLTVIAPGPDSIQFSQAMATFEYTASLPGAGLSAHQALIFEHAKYGLSVEPRWWEQMRRHVRTQPLSVGDIRALSRLVEAQTDDVIRADPRELGRLLREARDHHPRRAVLATIHANYLLNVANDMPRAEAALQHAVTQSPRSARRWEQLIRFQIVTGQLNEARAGISRLQELNRFRRLDDRVDELHKLLAQAEQAVLMTGQAP